MHDVCLCICIHTYIHTYIYIYICMCMYICMHVCIYHAHEAYVQINNKYFIYIYIILSNI